MGEAAADGPTHDLGGRGGIPRCITTEDEMAVDCQTSVNSNASGDVETTQTTWTTCVLGEGGPKRARRLEGTQQLFRRIMAVRWTMKTV